MKFTHYTITTILCCMAFAVANAQTESLEKAIDKINTCKNFSYTVLNTEKDIFSDQLSHETINACFISRVPATDDVPYYNVNYTLLTSTFSGSYQDIYNGKHLILLDFSNKTYRLKDGEQTGYSYQGSVPDLLKTAIKDLKSSGFKAVLLGDITVSKTLCYHIKVIPADTAKLDSRRDFCISKANNTLVYFRNTGSGEASKGGMSLGTVHIFIEDHFSAYKFNSHVVDIAAMGVPADFKAEAKPKPLLKPGDIAPNWKLYTTKGQSLSLASLKGKVALIDFTGDGCPACMLAIPPLNNLQQKYKGTNVAIISINIDGTKTSIAKLVHRYHITYPVYINGKVTGDAYHVEAIPNFYIIDKQGIVSAVHDGFFDNFEQQITAEIEKLR